MAPEVLGCQKYTLKADVYSFGVVMWEIITRETPYRGVPVSDIKFRVLHSNQRPDSSLIPPNCPKALKKLMNLCWRKEPEKRPSFSAVVDILSNIKLNQVYI